MKKIYTYFEKLYNENKINHAFLIGNIYFEQYKSEIEEILQDFFFKNKLKIENNPDVYILVNDGKNVTKEQIKDLINKLSITSQSSGLKVYIIPECEKLSDTAYNALLKTIEEPEEGIIALLISSNLEKVKDTIQSRCTCIYLNSDEEESGELSDITKKLIQTVEENNILAIVKNPEIYNEINDRTLLNITLKQMLSEYKKALYILINKEKTSESITKIIIEKNNIDKISEKLLIINKFIEKTEYYLNKNLTIDKIIIELGRCNNETSIC